MRWPTIAVTLSVSLLLLGACEVRDVYLPGGGHRLSVPQAQVKQLTNEALRPEPGRLLEDGNTPLGDFNGAGETPALFDFDTSGEVPAG